MKKWLIGSLVGAILVFGWQALSHTVLGLHNNDMKYSSAQTEILANLSANLKEDGAYMIPNASDPAEMQKVMEANAGKPWATIVYHSSLSNDMAMPMIRGFLVTIFLVVVLIYLLTRGGAPASVRIIGGSVALGLAYWLQGPYTGHIWYQLPWHMIKADLIDSLAAWTLCGIWLSWWLPKQPKRSSSFI
ncbi:MAG: hypothetical protein IPQ08_02045 [Chitinophagaceae bacterium]|nr:hypothetical protein [Chitinophagaceae bacterium]